MFEYPLGTDEGYTPVTVQPTVLSISPSSLTIASADGVHPNAPDPDIALERFWRITETGDLTVKLGFRYLDEDVPENIFSESTLALQRFDGAFTAVPTQVNEGTNTLTATGISTFSDWTAFGSSPDDAERCHRSHGKPNVRNVIFTFSTL